MGGLFSCNVLKKKVHPLLDVNRDHGIISIEKIKTSTAIHSATNSKTKDIPMGLITSTAIDKSGNTTHYKEDTKDKSNSMNTSNEKPSLVVTSDNSSLYRKKSIDMSSEIHVLTASPQHPNGVESDSSKSDDISNKYENISEGIIITSDCQHRYQYKSDDLKEQLDNERNEEEDDEEENVDDNNNDDNYNNYDDMNNSYDYGDETALNMYLHSSMSSTSSSACLEQLELQSRMILDNMDEQTSTMFDVTALSLDMDREDLLLNMLYFSNQNQNQTQQLQEKQEQQEQLLYNDDSNEEDYLHQSILNQSIEGSLINQSSKERFDENKNNDDDNDEYSTVDRITNTNNNNYNNNNNNNSNDDVLRTSHNSHLSSYLLSSSTSSTTSPTTTTTTRRSHAPSGTHPYPVMPVTFGQMFNSTMEETVAMHSHNNTPYTLKPLTATSIEKLLLRNSKESSKNVVNGSSYESSIKDSSCHSNNNNNHSNHTNNNNNNSGSSSSSSNYSNNHNHHVCSICMDTILLITTTTTTTATTTTTITTITTTDTTATNTSTIITTTSPTATTTTTTTNTTSDRNASNAILKKDEITIAPAPIATPSSATAPIAKVTPEAILVDDDAHMLSSAGIIRLPDCGHIFHSECLLKWVTLQDWCPECRTVITANSTPR